MYNDYIVYNTWLRAWHDSRSLATSGTNVERNVWSWHSSLIAPVPGTDSLESTKLTTCCLNIVMEPAISSSTCEEEGVKNREGMESGGLREEGSEIWSE